MNLEEVENIPIDSDLGKKILVCVKRIVHLYQANQAMGFSETASSLAAINQVISENKLSESEQATLFLFLEYNSIKCGLENQQKSHGDQQL